MLYTMLLRMRFIIQQARHWHDWVDVQVAQMRSVLLGHRNKQRERQWCRAEQGELDEHKLVDGITGTCVHFSTQIVSFNVA